jgi:hypothetical protein
MIAIERLLVYAYTGHARAVTASRRHRQSGRHIELRFARRCLPPGGVAASAPGGPGLAKWELTPEAPPVLAFVLARVRRSGPTSVIGLLQGRRRLRRPVWPAQAPDGPSAAG